MRQPLPLLYSRRTPLLACLLFIVITCLWHSDAVSAPPEKVIVSPEAAKKDAEFQLQGEYTATQKGIQVIAIGKGEFRAIIYTGGLPGAGWDRGKIQQFEGDADEIADLVEAMEKVVRKSSTLGLKAPAGSIILFDGTDATFKKEWKAGKKEWKAGAKVEKEPAGKSKGELLLMQGATSSRTFRDFSAHIEFRLPFMPEARGQGRGNSGAYYQGRYETQILDSFGLEGDDNETGGIYGIRKPDLNMCFPPLSWQTYDADFTAAQYNKAGKKIRNARITVKLNGVTVQDDVEIPNATRAAPAKEADTPGPLYLQDHGNPVRFRNIWILPRNSRAHARRPRVPGFERFFSRADQDQITGGRLLLGELNCISCHQADGNWQQTLLPKQAPHLTGVGSRVYPDFIQKFILSPHNLKPGSTMPAVLAGLSEEERRSKLEPIAHFLASTGKLKKEPIDRKSVGRGKKLFKSIGCEICHGSQLVDETTSSTSVPLGLLHKKYGLSTLKNFLKDPHAIRPSGRMPRMHLDDKQASDLASYLLRHSSPELSKPNVLYELYQGEWQELPDFNAIKPIKEGKTAAFDLSVAGQGDKFGIVFTGWISLQKAGKYRFHLGSDDGSRLLIDGNEIIKNDGIHPHTTKSGEVELQAGIHEIRVEYFELAGEESVHLEIEGPSLGRQDISNLIRATREKEKAKAKSASPEQFVFDASEVDLGRKNFSAFGCANCHEMKVGGERLPSLKQGTGKTLSNLDPNKGCLSEKVPAGLPQYDLSNEQRIAIRAAISAGPQSTKKSSQQLIIQTMATFNCYACHQRDKIGGPEPSRNAMFVTSIPEMGEEGRLPPPLDGVADKLQTNWLKKILQQGAQDRPYMLTRMPAFHSAQVDQLVPAFVKIDWKSEWEAMSVQAPEHRVKAIGRELVSGKALACIKCHTFAQYPATGIQAISLTKMHQRLRLDWFAHYLIDPQKFRPGTRMPGSFVNGVSARRDILKGEPDLQITAIWTYLQDGEKAGIPDGLLPDPIELIPKDHPIIYRNFIEGTSPRGIAVGYPEHVNIAWDANDLCLKLIWHGKFIDASKHWRGRGQGKQSPLGIHVMKLEKQTPWAVHSGNLEQWPQGTARERGFRFVGYRLDKKQRPIFMYQHNQYEISEQFIPLPSSKTEANLKRIFKLKSEKNNPAEKISFLVASGKKIEIDNDQAAIIDDAIRISTLFPKSGQSGKYRRIKQNGMTYLVMDINMNNGPVEFVQIIGW